MPSRTTKVRVLVPSVAGLTEASTVHLAGVMVWRSTGDGRLQPDKVNRSRVANFANGLLLSRLAKFGSPVRVTVLAGTSPEKLGCVSGLQA